MVLTAQTLTNVHVVLTLAIKDVRTRLAATNAHVQMVTRRNPPLLNVLILMSVPIQTHVKQTPIVQIEMVDLIALVRPTIWE
jgi:hypothetical protein